MKTINVGRAPDNDLVFNDDKVSRYHARLYYSSGSWYLVDLQSTHGTVVNGVPAEEPVKLKTFDSIKISDIKIVFDGSSLISASGRVMQSLPSPFSANNNLEKSAPRSGKLNVFAVLIAASIIILFGVISLALVYGDQTSELATPPVVTRQQGTISYNNGTYSGELVSGLPHGQGTLTYSLPDRSTSLASQDIITSIRAEAHVVRYTGQWEKGRKHGYGKETLSDGTTRVGYWQNGTYISSHGR